MKWSVIGLISVGLVAALCAAVLVAALRAGGLQVLTRARESALEADVVIATKDLPAMRVLDVDSVRVKKVARDEAPAGYFSNPLQVIGRVLDVPVVEGQVFTPNCFAAEGSGIQLASALKDGMRAVSVSLTDYAGLYGLLYPGSVVDVIATFRERAERNRGSNVISITLLSSIQVLGIEDRTVVSTPKEAEAKGRTGARQTSARWMVTLMVSAAQAQVLQLAMEHGTLSLAMRNPMDEGTFNNPRPISLEDVVRDRKLPSHLAGLFRRLLPDGAEPFPAAPAEVGEAQGTHQITIFRGPKAETVVLPVRPAQPPGGSPEPEGTIQEEADEPAEQPESIRTALEDLLSQPPRVLFWPWEDEDEVTVTMKDSPPQAKSVRERL